MRKVYLLVEGQNDAAFLRKVLSPEALRGVELIVAGQGIASLARSLLIVRRCPVAVLIDADSIEPDVVAEEQQSTEELIRLAAASTPVKVVTAVPQIESWFFAAPKSIERVIGAKVSDDFIELGQRDPKGVLKLLARKNNGEWEVEKAIDMLEASDIDRIRAIPVVEELTTFLEEMQKEVQAA
jgi:hypothetical protein